MLDTAGKYGSLLAVLVGLWMIYMRPSPETLMTSSKLDLVISSLLRYEANRPLERLPKIAVGYGACRDLFVSGAFIMANQSFPDNPRHFLDVDNMEQLKQMYAYFFRAGAAAERFVSDPNLFTDLVAQGEREEGHRWGLGGNAPVMAARFVKEGASVLLGAKLSPGLVEWVPQGMKVSGSPLSSDDIHLIMEYKREEDWDGVKAPRANRFIIHHDLHNPLISSFEEFADAIPDFNPNLLVVGGLQMMDNFPFNEGERLERILLIKQQMVAMSSDVRVHFEMASFVDNSLLAELAEHVIPQADSLGMNEQELPNLHSLLTKGVVSVISDSNPRIAEVLDQMRDLYRILSKNKDDNRPVTRIHLHTLAYQAILIGKGSPWKNTGAAAVKASLTAHRHVCAVPDVKSENSFLIMDDSFSTSKSGGRRIPFINDHPLTCWDEEDIGVHICIAPVLVCTDAVQTAGGGDNISAAGLVVQI